MKKWLSGPLFALSAYVGLVSAWFCKFISVGRADWVMETFQYRSTPLPASRIGGPHVAPDVGWAIRHGYEQYRLPFVLSLIAALIAFVAVVLICYPSEESYEKTEAEESQSQ